MKPTIDKTKFGSIKIKGKSFDFDVVIRLDGRVKKRKKKLSKQVFGTSHILSIAEVKDLYEKGAEALIVGSGQTGMVRLSDEAAEYLQKKKVQVKIMKTPRALVEWNEAKGAVIALFHVTC